MRDTNKEVKAFLEKRGVKSTSAKTSILKALSRLQRMGIYVEDTSDEMGYPNYRIRTDDGMVRVYKHMRNGWQIQCWKQVEFKYSGIPTFFSTGLGGGL